MTDRAFFFLSTLAKTSSTCSEINSKGGMENEGDVASAYPMKFQVVVVCYHEELSDNLPVSRTLSKFECNSKRMTYPGYSEFIRRTDNLRHARIVLDRLCISASRPPPG